MAGVAIPKEPIVTSVILCIIGTKSDFMLHYIKITIN